MEGFNAELLVCVSRGAERMRVVAVVVAVAVGAIFLAEEQCVTSFVRPCDL